MKAILRQALDALRDIDRDDNDRDFLSAAQCYMVDDAVAALQVAIDAPEPEPVGYFYCEDGHWQQAHDPIGFAGHTQLYLHPPAVREPLSDAEIVSLAYDCNAMPEICTDKTLAALARAIEAAHGIGVKP